MKFNGAMDITFSCFEKETPFFHVENLENFDTTIHSKDLVEQPRQHLSKRKRTESSDEDDFEGGNAPKRCRTAFTSHQLVELEKAFRSGQYIEKTRRFQIASSLELSERQVKIWFQNRRMKQKRNTNRSEENGVTVEKYEGKSTISYHPTKSTGSDRRKAIVSRLMAHSQFILPKVSSCNEKIQLLNSNVYDWNNSPKEKNTLDEQYIKRSNDFFPTNVDFFGSQPETPDTVQATVPQESSSTGLDFPSLIWNDNILANTIDYCYDASGTSYFPESTSSFFQTYSCSLDELIN